MANGFVFAAKQAQSVPLWVVFATSLVSGGLGAFLTAWWTRRAERDESWRERLIAAADDFLQRLLDAKKAYEETIHILRAGPQANAVFEDVVREQWGTAIDLTNEARHSNARLVALRDAF